MAATTDVDGAREAPGLLGFSSPLKKSIAMPPTAGPIPAPAVAPSRSASSSLGTAPAGDRGEFAALSTYGAAVVEMVAAAMVSAVEDLKFISWGPIANTNSSSATSASATSAQQLLHVHVFMAVLRPLAISTLMANPAHGGGLVAHIALLARCINTAVLLNSSETLVAQWELRLQIKQDDVSSRSSSGRQRRGKGADNSNDTNDESRSSAVAVAAADSSIGNTAHGAWRVVVNNRSSHACTVDVRMHNCMSVVCSEPCSQPFSGRLKSAQLGETVIFLAPICIVQSV